MDQTSGTDATDRIAELEADNRRLRRLLDQRDAPGELRHRLRGTVALMRTIVRRSADTPRDLETYVGHVEDRLDGIARAQGEADEWGAVDLHKLLADELLHYGVSEGDRAVLSGPEVDLTARAGQVMALAIHELAVNAVEHGALGRDGRLEVSWEVAPDGDGGILTLVLVWKERDVSGAAPRARPGFGTEVLTRMLPYELKAGTTISDEPGGLRCTLRVPLTDRTGRLRRE